MAGYLIATQTGLAYAQTVDPTQHGDRAPCIGNFLTLLGAVLIFATNLHHLAIGAIAGSYHMLPPGGTLADRRHGAARDPPGHRLLRARASSSPRRSWCSASRSMPALGVLARLMPQLQIYMVAMPVETVAPVILTPCTK